MEVGEVKRIESRIDDDIAQAPLICNPKISTTIKSCVRVGWDGGGGEKAKYFSTGFAICTLRGKCILTSYQAIGEEKGEEKSQLIVRSWAGSNYPTKMLSFSKEYDIALLECEPDKASEIELVTLGSKSPKLGEELYFVGFHYNHPDALVLPCHAAGGFEKFIIYAGGFSKGTSGSPILNKNHEVCGIVSVVNRSSRKSFREMEEAIAKLSTTITDIPMVVKSYSDLAKCITVVKENLEKLIAGDSTYITNGVAVEMICEFIINLSGVIK